MGLQLSWFGATPGTPAESEALVVRGDAVQATSPEGEVRWMKVGDWIGRLAPRRIDTCDALLPDGTKAVLPLPKGTLVVHQTPPRTFRFQWIAPDSPAPFGPGTQYREVRLSLPYVVVLATFDHGPDGLPRLSNGSECFFANQPLDREGFETPLSYPALLNCSRFGEEVKDKPWSWICVQHLSRKSHAGGKSAGDCLRLGLGALLRHLFESGFNLSSEHHEESSWFSETVARGVDPRVSSVEAWEAASAEDPLFGLEVPWIPTGHSLGQVIERMAELRGGQPARAATAADLARVVFRHGEKHRTEGAGDE